MGNLKSFINTFIKTIVLSSIVFYIVKIYIGQYLLIMLALWVMLFLNYSLKKNNELFDMFIVLSLGNLISYIFVNDIYRNVVISEKITLIGISAISGILFVLSVYSFFINLFKNKNKNNRKLIYKRRKDLERLLEYLNMFDIIGVNAIWGGGKSFLVDELKKKIRKEYEIIEIDILTCNHNELQLILLKEIEKVMLKNRIASKYSNNLKRFLVEDNVITKLWNLAFTDDYSFSETIKGFQEELNKIDKKILIIYEDIDRVSDKDIIKSIFGLSEKLSNNKIKILYQYHEDNLKDLGFKSDYLEKYIPYKMNLTELSFFEILNFVLNEIDIDKSIIEMKDFEFLKDYSQQYRYNVLQREFGMNKEISFNISIPSIRRVEQFVNELKAALADEQYKKNKETVISFLFVKHFIPKVYEKLSIDEGLVETLKFSFDSQLYTMEELIAMHKSSKLDEAKIDEMFNIEDNKNHYCVLKLFNYKHNSMVGEDEPRKRLNTIMEESIDILIDKNNNDKKDRLIWSLLANGKSKYTNYEYIGNKFIEDVLAAPRFKQVEAFNEFSKSIFNLDSYNADNRTIFRLGVPSFIELFKAFRILKVTSKEEIGLFDLYIEVSKIKEISTEFIQTINYCPLETRQEYIYILNTINKLNITGNLNSEKCFGKFLERYIGALSKLGYINTVEYYSVNEGGSIKGHEDLIIRDLKKVIKDINNLKSNIKKAFQIKELENDLDTVTKFAEKMIKLINYNVPAVSEEKGFVKSSVSSAYQNGDEFDRLKALLSENSENSKEVRKSFLEGKITAYEIERLINGNQ